MVWRDSVLKKTLKLILKKIKTKLIYWLGSSALIFIHTINEKIPGMA